MNAYSVHNTVHSVFVLFKSDILKPSSADLLTFKTNEHTPHLCNFCIITYKSNMI